MTELQQRRLGLLGAGPGDAQCLRDALGKRERILLFATQHPHGLLQLAVERGGFLQWHADALGDGEQLRLRDRVLALARSRELQARGHHVPGVGYSDDLLDLSGRPVDRQEGQQLALGPVDLFTECRHPGLHFGNASGRLVTGRPGGRRQLTQRLFCRGDGTLEPFVGSFERDKYAYALARHSRYTPINRFCEG